MRPTRRPASDVRSRSVAGDGSHAYVGALAEFDQVLELGQLPGEPINVPADNHVNFTILGEPQHFDPTPAWCRCPRSRRRR